MVSLGWLALAITVDCVRNEYLDGVLYEVAINL
jgi:hypothetical protein